MSWRSTRPINLKRSATSCSCALGLLPSSAPPVTVTRPSPPRALACSMRALSPSSRTRSWPSLTLTPCSRLRTPMPLPVSSPV
ncbi:MAG: hypothetical protein ACK5UM_17180 [Pseudomonadota bacterium]